jgi:hypothetical protein
MSVNKIILLEKYIKKAIRLALKEEEQKQKKAEKAMYFIHKFPGLKKTLEELMSPSFGRYIADISLISPKPTTFGIELINGQDFSIVYIGRGSFVAKIAGKKYNPINIGESERASQAITHLLELNYAPKESSENLDSQRDMDIKNDLEGTENQSTNSDFSQSVDSPEEIPSNEPDEPENQSLPDEEPNI